MSRLFERALQDPQLWRSTHRVFGAAFVVSGVATICAAVAMPVYWVIVAVVSILASCLVGWLASIRVGVTGGRASLATLLIDRNGDGAGIHTNAYAPLAWGLARARHRQHAI